jgi:hypothetical protein
MQLIDKDKVVEEINSILDSYDPNEITSGRYALVKLREFLNTLEVKEVDLVEELDYDDYMTFFKEHPEYNNGDWGFEETWTFGQYCYKLGLNARKGE